MIYLISGESFQAEAAYQRLKDQLLPPEVREFNFDRLEGRHATAREIASFCRHLPVLSRHRLIVVEEADRIPKREMEGLADLLPEISKGTEVIFRAEKADRRLRFWQCVGELGKVMEFRPPSLRTLPQWISAECRERRLTIQNDAIQWLAVRYGTELGMIVSALQKASLLAGQGREISLRDLQETAGSFPWESLFDLMDAIGTRSLSRALILFHKLWSSGENPVAVLSLIARHYRILLKVKETGQGAPSYFLKNYQAQARGYRIGQLRIGLDKIFRADWRLKSAPFSQKLVLEDLIRDLCRG